MKLFFTLISLVLVFSSCEKTNVQPIFQLEEPTNFNDEDYEIYNVVFSSYSEQNIVILQESSILIEPKSTFEESFQLSAFNNMENGLYDNFILANSTTEFFGDNFNVLDKTITVISQSEYSYIFDERDSNSGWRLFKERFQENSGMFIKANSIVYSSDGLQAFAGGQNYWYLEVDGIYTTQKRGWISYLEKIDGVWTEIKWLSYSME